ncbi:MAG TPA: 2-phospho-L-lactate transferase CofD family protein [Pyrinomonadaceae bacterium]|nr:2-phospho-L-lactate transferase CofD family protein [Pyrinomonadaceae bacterium]
MKELLQSASGFNVVILCGGRGSGPLANQLLDQGARVTCLVNAYDDGLSTGRLRYVFDELGPSDLRKNLLSLMNLDAPGYWSRYEVFAYRYPAEAERAADFRREVEDLCATGGDTLARGERRELLKMVARMPADARARFVGYLRLFLAELVRRERTEGAEFSFADCALGNCILLGAYLEHGRSWTRAIRALEETLQVRGRMEIASEENRHLFALCTDGRVLPSEASVITDADGDILELFLAKEPVAPLRLDRWVAESGVEAARERIRREVHAPTAASPEALAALRAADVIIYGPGTFHSSLLPTLMIEGVSEAIRASRATKIMVVNIVEEADTRGLTGAWLAAKIEEQVGAGAYDYLIANVPHHAGGEGYFTFDEETLRGTNVRLATRDLEDRTRPGRHRAPVLVQTILGIVRPEETAALTAHAGAEQPLVSIVMLAWNRKGEVEIGLNELRKLTYPNIELIVVDNGSTDGTAQMVYEKFPEVTVVRLHTNTGMTGYNVGFATARGKYVAMLDDDSHLAPESVETMVKLWEDESNRDVAVMAFRVMNPHLGSLVTHLWEERLVPTEPGREREITSFAACGAAIRRDVLDVCGYFDDDFFIYATEDDLAIRLWDAGYKIIYEPRCLSYHRESRQQRSWKRYGRGFRNAAWFNLKHLPWRFLPTVFVRNLFWLTVRGIRFRSFAYFFYGLVGYFQGYLQCRTALRKRRRVKTQVARFCLEDDWISRPVFSTVRRIFADKRYILDKRGVAP